MTAALELHRELAGSRALVVGGYGGIGTVVCTELAEAGAAVAVAGRSLEKATALAAELTDTGATAAAHVVDVNDRASVQRLVAAVVSSLGGIDILVNCASVLVTSPAEQFDEADWRAVLEVNLVGAFWLSQAVGQLMINTGAGGRIIHLSSVRSQAGASRGFSAYGASKAGLNLLVKQLATEWGRHRIAVNAVAPGFVRTEFVQAAAADPQFLKMVTGRIPLGRTAEAGEIADAVLYLASPRSSFITGQILFVDGGVTASQ